jgi:hypothetical protein
MIVSFSSKKMARKPPITVSVSERIGIDSLCDLATISGMRSRNATPIRRPAEKAMIA